LVDIPVDAQTLARRLTDTGSEIEGMETPVPLFHGAVTARVATIQIHPTRHDLFVLDVDALGKKGVCVTAAKNLREGDIVPWGPPGCVLADGATISTRDFDGVVSEGMVLSAEEIGLPDIADEFGILRLGPEYVPGVDVREALGLNDTILELSVTPNRGDLLSMTGIAREVFAVLSGSVLKPLDIKLPPKTNSLPGFRGVTLDDPGCPFYTLGAIDNVKIAPSPMSIRVRLVLAGMRPISNVVDATNIVMLLLGQPLHAFDASGLPADEITVRSASEGETILTLDGKTRVLDGSDMVITSGGQSVGVAGIMGGGESEICAETERVLLEAAHFDSIRTSRTSRKLGLPSEAAYRYSRYVDSFKAEPGLAVAMNLMSSWGAGVPGGWISSGSPSGEGREVTLSSALLKKIINNGDLDMATGILDRLGITTRDIGPSSRTYSIPSYRPDISIEEDLVEEVARIRGYDKIVPALPPVLHSTGDITDRMRTERSVRGTAIGRGYSEVITYSFISPASLAMLKFTDPDRRSSPVALSNPLSIENSVLRTTLAPGLIEAALANIRSGWRGAIRMFETGMVFFSKGEEVQEQFKLGGCVCPGRDSRSPWGEQAIDDFHSVSADIEAICSSRGVGIRLIRGEEPFGHPGKTAHILAGEKRIGYLLALKPEIEAALDLPAPMYLFEIDMDVLVDGAVSGFGEARRYPPVYRDISILVEDGVYSADVLELVRSLADPLLESAWLFDVYAGEGIPEGYRSLAFSLAYRDPSKTLRDDDVDRVHERLRVMLKEKGITLR
ncbi:MAG: phenylalanine--tRNA ligase subunit beta, partial [Thermovirgaceae bacterium]|nr:phenylalanine--tRNA ligase subunit beta [Thermovirgaceae bacterium]